MRKYTDRFVATKLFNRLHSAACPFPGRYPLRLFVKNGGVVNYHGKFHSAAWRSTATTRRSVSSMYLIYDKAGAVLWGSGSGTMRNVNENLTYRYFATNWIQGVHLNEALGQTIGTYRVYLNNADTRLFERPVSRSRFIHYVNTNIAHVRTI